MWVTQSKVCDELGYTRGQIKARVQRGHWRQGIEWAWIDGSRLFDLDAINARSAGIAVTQSEQSKKHSRRVVRLV
jgi:hypothetical protein